MYEPVLIVKYCQLGGAIIGGIASGGLAIGAAALAVLLFV